MADSTKRGKDKERSNGEGSWRQLPDGRWWGQVTLEVEHNPDGTVLKQHRKSKIFDKKGDLQKWMTELQDQKNKNLAVLTDNTRFGPYMQNWLETFKKNTLKPKTYESYSDLINSYIVGSSVERIKLQDLTARHLQKLYNDLFATGGRNKQGLSSRTVKYLNTIISACLEKARRSKLVYMNVSEDVELPKGDKKTKDAYTPEEINALLQASRELNLSIHNMILLAVFTGLRRGEIIALQWKDIDYIKKIISVRRSIVQLNSKPLLQENTKSEAGNRIVSINHPAIMDMLKAQREKVDLLIDKGKIKDLDFVFPAIMGKHKYNFMWGSSINHAFTKAIEEAAKPPISVKVRPLGFHSLRHTNATVLSNSGIGLSTVQNHLGHSDLQATQIYLHPDEEQAHSCINPIADFLKL